MLYVYRCSDCDATTEDLRSARNRDDPIACPECGGSGAQRVVWTQRFSQIVTHGTEPPRKPRQSPSRSGGVNIFRVDAKNTGFHNVGFAGTSEDTALSIGPTGEVTANDLFVEAGTGVAIDNAGQFTGTDIEIR